MRNNHDRYAQISALSAVAMTLFRSALTSTAVMSAKADELYLTYRGFSINRRFPVEALQLISYPLKETTSSSGGDLESESLPDRNGEAIRLEVVFNGGCTAFRTNSTIEREDGSA